MRICSFYQRLYLPCGKPFSPITHFKFIQSSVQNPENTTVLSLSQSHNFGSNFISASPLAYSRLSSQCAISKSLTPGMEIHARAIKVGFSRDPKIKNHLINLYAKSPFFGYARKLVDESPDPDLVSWSALISGYAQNGLAEEAILSFSKDAFIGSQV